MLARFARRLAFSLALLAAPASALQSHYLVDELRGGFEGTLRGGDYFGRSMQVALNRALIVGAPGAPPLFEPE